jgi:hypothetical protein
MKRQSLACALLAAGSLTLFVGCKGQHATVNTTQADAHPGSAGTHAASLPVLQEQRALSLRVLAQEAARYSPKTMPEEIKSLAGLTHLSGYIVDKGDVILFGSTGAGPALRLDDLIVALQNAYLCYATRKGQTIYYTAPGVSIDPDPAIMYSLGRIEQRLFQNRDPQAIGQVLKEWKRVAQGPQKTRILGMPLTCMADSALRADYRMKSLVDGTAKVPGLTSLTDLRQQAWDRAAKEGHGNAVPAGSFNRFWFTPGETRFLQDQGSIELSACPVTLRTEAELLVSRTKIAGSGKADALAKQFCANFTRLYPTIARESVYADLENQFRWVALAAMMKKEDVFQKSGLSSGFFLQTFRPTAVNVPATLPGIANIRTLSTSGKREQRHQWTLTVGGVNMGQPLTDRNIRRDGEGHLHTIVESILKSRPASPALFWRFQTAALSPITRP